MRNFVSDLPTQRPRDNDLFLYPVLYGVLMMVVSSPRRLASSDIDQISLARGEPSRVFMRSLTFTCMRRPPLEQHVQFKYRHHNASRALSKTFSLTMAVIAVNVVPPCQHWFQDRIHEGIQKGERSCAKTQQCPACHDMEHTLVVAMWRNPYDWIVAMSEYPHHAKVKRLHEFR